MLDGFVALVTRGGTEADGSGITFGTKAERVIAQGARAIVVVNNNTEDDKDLAFTLSSPGAWEPSVAVETGQAGPLAAQAAAGRSLRVVVRGADYASQSGTSMATPHATGVAALVWSARPSLTAAQVRALLEDAAQDLGAHGKSPLYGSGLVQAKDALELLRTRHP